MRTPILLIFLFGFSIIYEVEAYPAKHEPADNNVYGIQHCVNMTQENEEKISAIVTKLSEFLYNLTIEHEVFDIRLLKIVIEGHSDDEVEEKDTQVQLVVNDCAQANEYTDGEDLEEILYKEDPYEKKESIKIDFEDQVNKQSETKDAKSNTTQTTDKNKNKTSATDDYLSNDDENSSQKQEADNNDTQNTNDDEESTTTSDDATNETVAENNDTENPIDNEESTTTNDKTTARTVADNNNEENTNKDAESKPIDQTTAFDQSEHYSTDNVESGKSEKEIDDIQPSSSANYEVPGPVIVRLDLDKNGNKLIRGTQVKRGEHVPLLLYVQRALGNVEYLFAN
ncbi:hypothetical protein ABMA27_012305 [Loxostege sticticalis]|uniref:Uncharacterized protein n=1 Tax=Loxostege sticticalis TaxID=481309 RepID=A0ABR3H0U7_LOXSC